MSPTVESKLSLSSSEHGSTGGRGTGVDLGKGARLKYRRDSGIHTIGEGARRRRFGFGAASPWLGGVAVRLRPRMLEVVVMVAVAPRSETAAAGWGEDCVDTSPAGVAASGCGGNGIAGSNEFCSDAIAAGSECDAASFSWHFLACRRRLDKMLKRRWQVSHS